MQQTYELETERPRNVNSWQAAAILYGDWGTSKVYIIGLAFAIGGFSSFWLILAVSILNIVIAINYITVCKCYPNGGGVYSAVRSRSKVLALVGGLFLIADYIVTAALSAFSAFSYLGVAQPEFWSISIILFIGCLNYLGPRNTGNIAFGIGLSAVLVVLVLGLLSLFHLSAAISHVEPITWSIKHTWISFVGVIVALSGIEAIANTTGVMKLDPGSTPSNPSVMQTARPAILRVMFEVCFFTTLFALVINALPGLTITGDEVSAPGYPNVRDAMLRYMGEVFAGEFVTPHLAVVFGLVISVVFGALLLSAVNTSIVALNSLLYVMSRDGQLPALFQKMNYYGVPLVPLFIAAAAPAVVLFFVNDLISLANLYAVGFVGAIATNLGSTSTDFHLRISSSARIFMFCTFLFMAAIEVTLFIEKNDARAYVIAIMATGLLLRSMVIEHKERQFPHQTSVKPISETAWRVLHTKDHIQKYKTITPEFPLSLQAPEPTTDDLHLHAGAILCAATHPGKSLEFALKESIEEKKKLYILFVREEKIMGPLDDDPHWLYDQQACKVFDTALEYLNAPRFEFIYAISNNPALTIVEQAKKLEVSNVILGMSRENRLVRMIRGNVVHDVRNRLPPTIDLIVVS